MIRAVALALMVTVSSAAAETPLSRLADGRFAAPVRVAHGAPAMFVIDTGAAGCSVSRRFVQERRLLPVGERSVRAPAVELDGMRLGALVCRVSDDENAAGLIGADALSRFVVVFDAPRRRLSLHGGAQHGQALVSPRARLVYDKGPRTGPLTAPVRLNSARGVGVLDTGATVTVTNTRFAEAAGAENGERATLDLAGARTGSATVSVRGEGAAPTMRVGLDRLSGLRLVLDYPRRRIWLDPG